MLRIIHFDLRDSLTRRAGSNIRALCILSDWWIGEDAKTVTPAGAPGDAGAACAAWHFTVLFSQKVLAVQKAMTHTDLLGIVVA